MRCTAASSCHPRSRQSRIACAGARAQCLRAPRGTSGNCNSTGGIRLRRLNPTHVRALSAGCRLPQQRWQGFIGDGRPTLWPDRCANAAAVNCVDAPELEQRSDSACGDVHRDFKAVTHVAGLRCFPFHGLAPIGEPDVEGSVFDVSFRAECPPAGYLPPRRVPDLRLTIFFSRTVKEG